MAFVVKTAKTVRNNWKKSVFFSGLAAYGVKWLNKKHEDNLMRRRYCNEALQYGNQSIELGERPRRVTVFLNPAAQGGRARKLFEKNAAPILYVAGIEVNVVSTEYEGQVKSFMSVLDTKDTDAVVVAGGDGTLLEAVTGFLRKEDKSFQENIPVGVIPLGETNRFSRILFGYDLDQVKLIAEAAIAVVRSVTKKVDVIKLDGGEGKTTYALCGLQVGAYRDAEERKSKYWYFGPLKHRWTYLRAAMKEWPPLVEASLKFLEATPLNMVEEPEPVKAPQRNWSFFSFLTGKSQRDEKLEAEEREKEEAKKREEEAQTFSKDVNTIELTVTPASLVSPQSLPGLQVKVGPTDPAKEDMIKEGWSRIKATEFSMGSSQDDVLLVKKLHIEPKETEGKWYNIDGEAFEAMPVDVSLLRNKLNFFCPTAQTAVS